MEQQEITVCAAITIRGPLVYHVIRWNVALVRPDGLHLRFVRRNHRDAQSEVTFTMEGLESGSILLPLFSLRR
jgi:hypothetical protein